MMMMMMNRVPLMRQNSKAREKHRQPDDLGRALTIVSYGYIKTVKVITNSTLIQPKVNVRRGNEFRA